MKGEEEKVQLPVREIDEHAVGPCAKVRVDDIDIPDSAAQKRFFRAIARERIQD